MDAVVESRKVKNFFARGKDGTGISACTLENVLRDSLLAAATRNRIAHLQIGMNWSNRAACVHNPKVGGSIPPPATKTLSKIHKFY